VLSIGLLGLAALLPIGRYAIAEANKADHAGNCGRAALRAVVIRHMLDSAPPQGKAAISSAVFNDFTDDLIVQLPEDMKPPQPIGKPTVAPDYRGDYKWFMTAIPNPSNPAQFTVSVVVCFKRDSTETTASIAAADFYDAVNGVALGGGSVKLTLTKPAAPFEVKENDWIALCGTSMDAAKPQALCHWYRVAAAGDDGVSLTLTGPDWDTSYTTTAVALGQSVLGVYTTTVEVPTDPTWKN